MHIEGNLCNCLITLASNWL